MKTTSTKSKSSVIERDMLINGTHIHIKSVFGGKVPLEKALGNIVRRKLTAKNVRK